MERSGKEPGNLRAPVAKVAASTLTVMVDRWELNKEDQFPISRFNQWAPNPAKAPTREQRASLFARRSPGTGSPAHTASTKRKEADLELLQIKAFPILKHRSRIGRHLETIETEWKADRESARGAGVQRERERAREREAGSARKTRTRSGSNGAGARERSYRTNADLRYWIGLLKTIIESVLNKRQKTRNGVKSSSPWRRSGRGMLDTFSYVKEESLYGYWFFYYHYNLDRYYKTLIRSDAMARATRMQRAARVFLCFSCSDEEPSGLLLYSYTWYIDFWFFI